jgi:WD40 repeat protein
VRIWNPDTAEQRTTLEGHQGGVNGVCSLTMAGRPLLASAGADGTVRIWDPDTGRQRAVLEGHREWVRAVCQVTVANQHFLASARADRTVRIGHAAGTAGPAD